MGGIRERDKENGREVGGKSGWPEDEANCRDEWCAQTWKESRKEYNSTISREKAVV